MLGSGGNDRAFSEINSVIFQINQAPLHPWRIIDQTTNIALGDGWYQFNGKVFQNLPGQGIIVQGGYGRPNYHWRPDDDLDLGRLFFVANFPIEMPDDSSIGNRSMLTAKSDGLYTYNTANGSIKTIARLEYGIPCSAPQWYIDAKIESDKQDANAEITNLIILDKKKRTAATNAFKYLLSDASNKMAYAQYSVGLRYLNGNGCETNALEAIRWLKLAAAQGNIEASNKLAKINAGR